MAHGAAGLVKQHEGLIATPDGIALHIGQRGFHINEVPPLYYRANGLDVVHLQIDGALLVAALAQNEIGGLGGAPEAGIEIAEDLADLILAVDVENDIAREHRENFHAIIGPLQLLLIAHLLGDVDDGDVEPGRAGGIHHITAAVVHPAHLAVGAVQAIGHRIGVARRNLLGNLSRHTLAVIGMHHAQKRVARDGAELIVGGAPEHGQHVSAHVIDGAALVVGAIAKQAAGNAVEEFLGHLVFDDASIARAELALRNPMKHCHDSLPTSRRGAGGPLAARVPSFSFPDHSIGVSVRYRHSVKHPVAGATRL